MNVERYGKVGFKVEQYSMSKGRVTLGEVRVTLGLRSIEIGKGRIRLRST